MKSSLILFIAGIILAVFSHPRVSRFFMTRFYNEGLVTPRKYKPEKVELIRYAGPNLSLFALGIILMLLGLILRES